MKQVSRTPHLACGSLHLFFEDPRMSCGLSCSADAELTVPLPRDLVCSPCPIMDSHLFMSYSEDWTTAATQTIHGIYSPLTTWLAHDPMWQLHSYLIHHYCCIFNTYEIFLKYLNCLQKTSFTDHFWKVSFYWVFTNVLFMHNLITSAAGIT